ncbi:hypothetical protein M409DRAFT_31201 [Zasmidium cellare ATCC 36951]|uniref:Uncharacterized protein n=1 Tax=Zasmidium cellare ATCC 36951 TaxID=1080233 RepID=A0A6A6BU45_ZASCE|nr:uncharacterized protein M409DRAFT_31201 [Zasmidium cellare ATCC 36951]KAF2158291.1 hypothetical protein M409DRAFT_31201 [Zasmidium cellare ATCC 36951]
MEELEAKVKMHEQRASPLLSAAGSSPRPPPMVSPPPSPDNRLLASSPSPASSCASWDGRRHERSWAFYDPELASYGSAPSPRRRDPKTNSGRVDRASRNALGTSVPTESEEAVVKGPGRTATPTSASLESLPVAGTDANASRRRHFRPLPEMHLPPTSVDDFINAEATVAGQFAPPLPQPAVYSADNLVQADSEEQFLDELRRTLLCELDSMNIERSMSKHTLAMNVPSWQNPYVQSAETADCSQWTLPDPPAAAASVQQQQDQVVDDDSIHGAGGGLGPSPWGASVETPASKQERASFVADGAVSVGFRDFDEAVEAYYNSRFGELSDPCTMQRLSRSRHLPKVLAKVRRAAQGWSEAERRGLEQEMVRCAEELLIEECDRFHAVKQRDRDSGDVVSTSFDASSTPSLPDLDLESNLQSRSTFDVDCMTQAPNLWALAVGLCTKANGFASEDRLHAASRVVSAICGPA